MERRGFDYYEARAQDVKMADITSCEYNARILRRLRDRTRPLDHLDIDIAERIDDDQGLAVDDIIDIGWVGYYIGKKKYLKTLWLSSWGEGEQNIEAFIEGLNRNRSIEKLHFYTDLRDVSFQSLSPFFRNNGNLTELIFYGFHGFEVGLECAQSIARTLAESQCQSLKYIGLEACNLSDEGLTEIATALRTYPQLEELNLESNNIGLMGCNTLEEMMRGGGASNLKRLYLDSNAIGDGGLQTLAAGLANTSLDELFICNNLITGAGLRSLSTFLQSENCRLRILALRRNVFGDEGAVALAEGLMGNKSLRRLNFDSDNSGITDVGWAAFSTLLCDPSSINSTYLSNHRIFIKLDVTDRAPPNVAQYLKFHMNPYPAIQKILNTHPDLDMEPLFRWKLRLLPVVMNWFESAKARMRSNRESEQRQGEQSRWSFEGRELSAVYKFVRGMPALTAVSYWQQFIANTQVKRRRIDDERRRLENERSRLYYEEEAAWVRLGGRPRIEGEGSSINVVSGAKRKR